MECKKRAGRGLNKMETQKNLMNPEYKIGAAGHCDLKRLAPNWWTI